MSKVTIERNGKAINNICFAEFSIGSKCIQTYKNVWTVFDSIEDAAAYIEERKKMLEEWINKDIPQQSKNWAVGSTVPLDNRRDTFLENSKKTYKQILRALNKLEIVEE